MLPKELIFLQVFSNDEFSTDFSASVDEAENLPKKNTLSFGSIS